MGRVLSVFEVDCTDVGSPMHTYMNSRDSVNAGCGCGSGAFDTVPENIERGGHDGFGIARLVACSRNTVGK